jgi:hypothetical protein
MYIGFAYKKRYIRLAGTSYHIFDEITVTWGINNCEHV